MNGKFDSWPKVLKAQSTGFTAHLVQTRESENSPSKQAASFGPNAVKSAFKF